jgi:hypothetical protein
MIVFLQRGAGGFSARMFRFKAGTISLRLLKVLRSMNGAVVSGAFTEYADVTLPDSAEEGMEDSMIIGVIRKYFPLSANDNKSGPVPGCDDACDVTTVTLEE